MKILQSSDRYNDAINKQNALPFKNKFINKKLALDNPLSDSNELSDYKDLLNRVSDKIEDWHKKIIEKKDGKFVNDDDFVEMQQSPTKFISD